MPDANQPTEGPAEGGLAVLQVDALLGAAYTAVVRAQAQAALAAVAVIDRVGFTTGADGSKTARVFEFAFHRHDLDSEAITTGGPQDPLTRTSQVQVSVPVLSLITPPNLIIDEAEIDMALEVVGHDQPPAPPEESGGSGNTDGAGAQDTGTGETATPPAVIHARVAAGHGEATLKVKSRLKQVPAGGAARIHQLLDTAISDLGHLSPTRQAAQDRIEAARLVQRLAALIDERLGGERETASMLLQRISQVLEFGGAREDLLSLTQILIGETSILRNEGNPVGEEIYAAAVALDAVATRLAQSMTTVPPTQPE